MSPPAAFWVEASNPSCQAMATAIANDLALACDASRDACTMAASKPKATRIVVLQCGGASRDWKLVCTDRWNFERWTLDVIGSGPEEDIARSAAMFAVRFETADQPPEPAPPPPRPVPASAPATAPASTASSPEEPSDTAKWVTIAGFGVGAVAGLAALTTGLLSIAKANDFEEQCAGRSCSPEHVDLLDDARTLGLVSSGFLATAVLGVTVGVVGAVFWSSSPRESKRQAWGSGPLLSW